MCGVGVGGCEVIRWEVMGWGVRSGVWGDGVRGEVWSVRWWGEVMGCEVMVHSLAGQFYKKYHITLWRALCACKHRVSGSFHSPPGVLFTFPSQYYYTIGHRVIFRLGGWSPRLPTGFLVSRGTLDPAQLSLISPTCLSHSLDGFPTPFGYQFKS